MRFYLLAFCCFFSMFSITLSAQYWQQEANYTMDIDMNVEAHQYKGKQTLVYTNNSPDELTKVFYHLYFNAFQPGSMMDVRNLTLPDADGRVGDRISNLKQDEIGYIKVKTLTMDGQPVTFDHVGTILEVTLPKGIKPNTSVTFEMTWDAQVPLQIRRSGRDSKEGIEFSMTQWYPKMCEYDIEGWHANPYIGREFHGIWGDFDVTIHIDRDYIVAGSGYLQNPETIGYGYEKKGQKVNRPSGEKLSWNFKAPNVHDFAWAADPDYVQTTAQVPGGPLLRFFYEKDIETKTNWENLPEYTIKAFEYIEPRFGDYPWKEYAIIQGGDGGMEYAMATLITGKRNMRSLIGVTVHEVMHSWYQMILGTNEALYAWMDEGFTTYATNETMNAILDLKQDNPNAGSYRGYKYVVEQGLEEPLTTHADHFATNTAYGIASYSKGAVFLHQLSYVVGQDVLDRSMLRYYDEWKFKHPTPRDFKRVVERESGLELDWYFEHFVQHTTSIDYSIEGIETTSGGTAIQLKRVDRMPMPLDVVVTLNDGSQMTYNIPLRIMRGAKKVQSTDSTNGFKVAQDWPWTNPDYTLTVPFSKDKIESVEIDPTGRMADLNKDNNVFPRKPKEDKE